METNLLTAIHDSIMSFIDVASSWPAPVFPLIWLAVVIAIWVLYQLVRHTIRIGTSAYYTATHRIFTFLGGIKTRIVCKFRELMPRRLMSGVSQGPEIEFDEIDLSVLRLAAAQGPGRALSAPDVAERLKMRPAKIEIHLARLANSKILENVIGATDGFDNYRLTDYGAAFLSVLSRNGQHPDDDPGLRAA